MEDFDDLFDDITKGIDILQSPDEILARNPVTLSTSSEAFLDSVREDEIVLIWRPLTGFAHGDDWLSAMHAGHISLQVGKVPPELRLDLEFTRNRFLSFTTSARKGISYSSLPHCFDDMQNEFRVLKEMDSKKKIAMRKIRFQDDEGADEKRTLFRRGRKRLSRTGVAACQRIQEGIEEMRCAMSSKHAYTSFHFNCASCILTALTYAAGYYFEAHEPDFQHQIYGDHYKRFKAYEPDSQHQISRDHCKQTQNILDRLQEMREDYMSGRSENLVTKFFGAVGSVYLGSIFAFCGGMFTAAGGVTVYGLGAAVAAGAVLKTEAAILAGCGLTGLGAAVGAGAALATPSAIFAGCGLTGGIGALGLGAFFLIDAVKNFKLGTVRAVCFPWHLLRHESLQEDNNLYIHLYLKKCKVAYGDILFDGEQIAEGSNTWRQFGTASRQIELSNSQQRRT